MPRRLDRIDVNILAELQRDARLTNLELADRAALSPSACLARVRKLREAGFIDRDVGVLKPSKIGPALHCLLEITLKNHSLTDHNEFEAGLAEIPQVTLALKVSGRFDYLLAVTTRDMPALNTLSDELLQGELGISKLVTIPVLDVAKPFAGFPIAHIWEGAAE